MPIIKLKVLDREGRTLAAAPPGENVTLVYGGCYQTGDWIALESDGTEMFCQIQLEDSMPSAAVYLPGGSLQYQIPPVEDRSNYSPKSFTGPVLVDELRLTLRADFPHDSWWEEGTVVFSDGSRETLRLEKLGTPQAFPIEPREVESLILKNLKKAPDSSPFPALTQLEVYGTEIFDKETM